MDQTVVQAFAAVPEPILFESDISLIAQAMLVGFQAGYYFDYVILNRLSALRLA
jgi:hypothetical protein